MTFHNCGSGEKKKTLAAIGKINKNKVLTNKTKLTATLETLLAKTPEKKEKQKIQFSFCV